jgi:hypothetical protein
MASYVAQADVLNNCRVCIHSLDDLGEELHHDAIDSGVLETTLIALGEGSTDGKSDDNVIGMLLSAT